MSSVFIVISIPSEEHENTLLMEENFQNFGTLNRKYSPSPKPECSVDSKPNIYRCCSETIINDMSEKCSMKPQSREVRNDSMPMEKKLEKCIKELKIPNAIWILGRARKYYQVSFCTPDGEQCERIIQLLAENKIGSDLNSTVSILPCTLNYEGKDNISTPNTTREFISAELRSHKSAQRTKEATAWNLFVNSVRARMMVAQVVAGVKNNATFTFDFLILLIIASITAAVGLVENSVVILVASVLISPLMGPVMASTFGFATRDWRLQKIGLLNETLGLLLCVLIGFFYGLVVGYLRWESPYFDWPTPEMIGRGDLRSLVVGALIAILSGGAVAIAMLGNHSGSLTGVAISASLMPPAVNAGLLWALAVVIATLQDNNPHKLTAFNTRDPFYELLKLGALSLALTFINIFCIFFMGIIVLKVKEVTPRDSKDYSKLLWKETINIARDHKYRFHQTIDRMEQGITHNQVPDILGQSPYKMYMNTWSAYGAIQHFNRPTVKDLTEAWHREYNLQPTTSTARKTNRILAEHKGSPIRPPDFECLSNIENPAMNVSSSSDLINTGFIGSSPPSDLYVPQRFIVTASDINNIL